MAQPDPSIFKNWLIANESKKGTDDYKAVEAAYNNAARIAGASQEWKSGTPTERIALMAAQAGPMVADFIKSAGIRGTPAVVGEMVGQRVAGPIGRRVGAGVGALGGSVADQMRQRGNVKMGETMADVATAVIQPRGKLAAGGTAAALDIAGQVVDSPEVDLKRAAATGAGAAIGTAAANRMARTSMRPEDIIMVDRYKAFEEVRPYGVKINPAEIERGIPGINQFAGIDEMSREAAKLNQTAWQKMVREQVDLPIDSKDLVLHTSNRKEGKWVKGTIDTKIDEVSAPFRDLEEISKVAAEEVEAMKKGTLRNPKYVTGGVDNDGIRAMLEAKQNLDAIRYIRRDIKDALREQSRGVPGARDKIAGLKLAEQEIEAKLDAAAIASGKEGLLDSIKDARQKVAVLKAVDNATTTYGLVDPALLSAQREAGIPLTGNLEKIALFHDAFKPSATEAVAAGPLRMSGMSPSYTARNVAMGNKQGMFSGGFPFAAQAARGAILSDRFQDRFVRALEQQQYDPVSSFMRLAPALASPQANPQSNVPGYIPTTMIPRFQ